jgi:hypothetical protein
MIDSCSDYATMLRKWTNIVSTSGFGPPAVSPGNGPNGLDSIRFPFITGKTTRYFERTFDQQQEWFITFSQQLDAFIDVVAICSVQDAGSLQCDVRINLDGTISVTRGGTTLGTTSFALTAGTHATIDWYIKIDNSVGATQIRVQGDIKPLDGNDLLSSIDTQVTANASANQVRFGSGAVAFNRVLDIAQIYINDAQGPANNSLPAGIPGIYALLPDADGSTMDWTPNTGAAHDAVDDTTPDDDTTYISSNTPGDIALFTYPALSVTSGDILVAQSCMLVRKDDAGTRTVTPAIKSGGSDYVGADANVGTSYQYDLQQFETDPDTGLAWTISGWNAAEKGIKLTA